MTNHIKEQIRGAQAFYLPRQQSLMSAAAGDGTVVPTMFQKNGNTTGSVMQFNGELPDSVSGSDRKAFAKTLKDQQFYLQSGLGLVTSWMTHTYQASPTKWADPACWQDPLSNLPSEFYLPTDITQYQFSEHMKGVEIATSFLESLVGWASGVGIGAGFTDFLTSMGKEIRMGVQSKDKSMETYHLSFGYRPLQDASGAWQLESTAEYYFISFSENEKTVYSNCGSAETFDFDFKYRKGTLLLNWPSLTSSVNKENRTAWDQVIAGATKDDVTKAKNFFGGSAKPKGT